VIDILFIHPGGQKGIYQELSNNLTAICPPAYTLLLADYVRRQGYSVAIHDCNISEWKEKTAGALIYYYEPKLIVIWVFGHHPSASTQTMPIASQIAKDIKAVNKDIPIAMGGIHPSALPERTLEEEAIDFVITGEGPYQIIDILDYIRGKSKGNSSIELAFKTPNLGLFCASERVFIEDLNKELIGYSWDLIPSLDYYRSHNFHCFQYFKDSKKEDFSDVRSPYAAIYTSLGCPNNCFYCCANHLHKGEGRDWELKTILRWIDELVLKYEVRNIRIHDHLFTYDIKKLESFADQIKERRYNLNLSIYARLDTLNDNTLFSMAEAGVKWIGIGIESINDIKNRKAKETIKMTQDYFMFTCTNYMFGMPNDTLQSMQETLDLALELNTEFANFYCTMAYPGSQLYEKINKEEPFRLPLSWEGYSQHGYETYPLSNQNLLAKEILAFRDKAFHRYFGSEKYLNMINKKFGSKVVKHIQDFNSIRLKRRLLEDCD